ncbi:hypothetical protein N5D77_06000 [Comamonas thiooxydans]|uniref:Uncharacterized protein n=1 Tax=Comamonas thiooxydans TaxID=363952 RepID=A0AA42PXZ9_9BURK|nr:MULTISPECIES: hypothetical protein [Comamonas]MDH1333252.1 hypothetical protein [Comamonas thiooxydans]MDH1738975.1 hypothetical protein [Comamonas thiooxydans]MDH1786122.1 hypothetical protein [Comamonas thiooxydans]MPS94990.1 hypothetical protein [Comamonas sp.]
MKRFLDTICVWLLALAVVLLFALSFGIRHYRQEAQTAGNELQQLQASVNAQNRTATAELSRLTLERNAAQARLDQLYQQQEKTDVLAVQEIARLSSELEQRPVRVRIVASSTTCGTGCGGPPDKQASATDPGSTDTAQAYGLLPESNSIRLRAVIAEAETINAAYASCRAALFGNNP